MIEMFQAQVMRTIEAFSMRMHYGPPLSEMEFCLYQQACGYAESYLRLGKLHLDRNLREAFPDEE